MNLMWHIVLKDARRLWLPLVLWIFLINTLLYVDWRLTHTVMTQASELERMKFFAMLLLSIQLLTGYALAAALVMEDPPMGTSTFWLTRPVSGARMMTAKVVAGGLLLMALPALVSLPWLVARDPEAPVWFASVCQVLRWQAWVIVPAMVIATFAGSSGKFLAWTLGVYPGAVVFILIWCNTGRYRLNSLMSPASLERMEASHASAIALMGAGVAMLIQYQTRRRKTALALLGLSTAGAVALALSAA